MCMCWKPNSYEKNGWQVKNGRRNFTLRVAQQQKMEFSLMSDIKLHSAQYSKFDPTYFKTEGKGTFDGTR